MVYEPAPIVLFAYNRPKHLQHTVESLQKNTLSKDSMLYVFSDGPKNSSETQSINETRAYLKTITGFKEIKIIERQNNLGLAKSVINGTTEVFKHHEKVIVIEDDLLFSSNFLSFMNQTLNYYENSENIFSISGMLFNGIQIPPDYAYDTCFFVRPASTGWATWKNRWLKTDWDVSDFKKFKTDKSAQEHFNQGGNDLTNMLIKCRESKIDSWAIIWGYHHSKYNAFAVYPTLSKVLHMGDDELGTHVKSFLPTHRPKLDMTNGKSYRFNNMIQNEAVIVKEFLKLFNR